MSADWHKTATKLVKQGYRDTKLPQVVAKLITVWWTTRNIAPTPCRVIWCVQLHRGNSRKKLLQLNADATSEKYVLLLYFSSTKVVFLAVGFQSHVVALVYLFCWGWPTEPRSSVMTHISCVCVCLGIVGIWIYFHRYICEDISSFWEQKPSLLQILIDFEVFGLGLGLG